MRTGSLEARDSILADASAGHAISEGKVTMNGHKTISDPELDIELGEEVEAAPRRGTGTAMVAVRLSAEMLERVDAYARANGLTMSDVLRQGVEKVLAGSGDAGPFIISGTIVLTGPGQTHGLASGGQGISEQLPGFGNRRPELTLAG